MRKRAFLNGYHLVQVDVVVEVDQVDPPIRTAVVSVGAHQKIPVWARAQFIEQSCVEANHHRVCWR